MQGFRENGKKALPQQRVNFQGIAVTVALPVSTTQVKMMCLADETIFFHLEFGK